MNIIKFSPFPVFVLLIMLSSCGANKGSGKVQTQAMDTSDVVIPKVSTQGGLDIFLAMFEKAVLSKDARRIMMFMDKTYRTEQHDSIMKGNTDRFLNAFFSGERLDNRVKHKTDYRQITSVKHISTTVAGSYQHVLYHIGTEGMVLAVSWVVMNRYENGTIIYGLYGPVES